MTATTTPLRKQYLDIKRRYPNALLLFRIGDFYEAFDDDARTLARELDIILTSKPMGKNVRVPLAGVPHHSLERHLATLISRGHRVAVCEQLSATPSKGEAGGNLIARDVVRVVTPGTVIEPGLLKSDANNYLASYVTDGKRAGVAYADVSTGDFAATETDIDAALPELQRIAPAELLIPRNSAEADSDALPGFVTLVDSAAFEFENARAVLLHHFRSRTLAPLGLKNLPVATAAAAAIISYLKDTQSGSAEGLTRLKSYTTEGYMMLDAQTVGSLEIFESPADAPTLFSILDDTRTAMGGRTLRHWLRRPLLDVAEIMQRQEHVAYFHKNAKSRAELRVLLESVHDIERLSARVRAFMATPQELLALGQSLEMIPRVRAILQRETKRFGQQLSALQPCDSAANLIHQAINDELPARSEVREIIRRSFSEELDRLRELLRGGKSFLAEMEQRERARTGIKSLRVGYNKVFGYFIEVTRPNLHLVPDDYTRKQTLAQGERFITLELKEYETLVVNAQERIAELEASLFRQVCAEIGKSRGEILAAAGVLAYLDVIAAFAEIAGQNVYVRPMLVDAPVLRIRAGRHPVLEKVVSRDSFVANDCLLGGDSQPQILLITGPNMSGKSSYLRQNALIVLLAQIGSFVPAEEVTLGLVDRIFTRIGLYDRIGSGESTFMTEMTETAQILHHAGPRSLILLDELGRGTSTYDGLAVARSVIEFIHNHPNINSKTLFATHYHELTELEAVLPRVKNLHAAIAEEGSELVFLYKIAEGSAQKSYGVYAAKLAGLPRPVVRRAEQLLSEYEGKSQQEESDKTAPTEHTAPPTATRAREIEQAILSLDLNTLTPVEALMKLFELRKLAEAEERKNMRAVKTA